MGLISPDSLLIYFFPDGKEKNVFEEEEQKKDNRIKNIYINGQHPRLIAGWIGAGLQVSLWQEQFISRIKGKPGHFFLSYLQWWFLRLKNFFFSSSCFFARPNGLFLLPRVAVICVVRIRVDNTLGIKLFLYHRKFERKAEGQNVL